MLKDNRCVGLKMSGANDYLAYYLEMLPTSFYLFIFSVKKSAESSNIWRTQHNTETNELDNLGIRQRRRHFDFLRLVEV